LPLVQPVRGQHTVCWPLLVLVLLLLLLGVCSLTTGSSAAALKNNFEN
jgi:hypothetical protein